MRPSAPKIVRTPTGSALLNVGCGANFSREWTNLDLRSAPGVIRHDLRRPLPFGDRTFDGVYSSHVLEHLTPVDGARLLREIHRILRPGGTVRVVVPDLEGIAEAYLARLREAAADGSEDALRRYRWSLLELIDQMVRDRPGGEMARALTAGDVDPDYVRERGGDEFAPFLDGAGATAAVRRTPTSADLRSVAGTLKGLLLRSRANPRKSGETHRWMYDRLSLRLALEEAGFADVSRVEHDRSEMPEWDRYRLDTSADRTGARKPDSLFMEARRR